MLQTGNHQSIGCAAAWAAGHTPVVLVLGLQQDENKGFCTYEGCVT